MTYSLTPTELVSMMLEASNDIDTAQRELETSLHAEARAHEKFIMAQANAWRGVTGPNKEFRIAMVNEITVKERYTYEVQVASSKVALEAVRNERQKLSALQSAANSIKEEAALARTGPDLTSEEARFRD